MYQARTLRRTIATALIYMLGVSASQLPAETVDELIAAANARTKTAKTADQFAEIVKFCQQIEGRARRESEKQYALKLSAWAHNRIGEIHVARAAEHQKKKERQAARQADDLALRHFEIAIIKNPQHWKARHNRGVSYALLHRYEDAIKDFSAAIKSKPEYTNSWFNRAEIYYELGRYDRAIADYTRVLSKTPKDVAALIQRGHARFRAKQVTQSITDYAAAIQIDPKNADAFVFRGDAYQSRGQWRQAALDYRQAIQLDAKNAHAFRSSAWLMATCPEKGFRDPQRGVEAAELAGRLYGDSDFRTLDALAAAYANAGDFVKARRAIDEAIEAAPKSALSSLVRRQQLYAGKQPYRQPSRIASRPAKTKRQ